MHGRTVTLLVEEVEEVRVIEERRPPVPFALGLFVRPSGFVLIHSWSCLSFISITFMCTAFAFSRFSTLTLTLSSL